MHEVKVTLLLDYLNNSMVSCWIFFIGAQVGIIVKICYVINVG